MTANNSQDSRNCQGKWEEKKTAMDQNAAISGDGEEKKM
jgi:hypothetical protein